MKYLNIGLFSYCLNLGNSLKKLSFKSDCKITYYYPSGLKEKYFGTDASYLYQNSFQKLIFPNTDKFNVWHCTHQDSSYHPKNKQLKKVLTIHDLNFLHEANVSGSKIKRRLNRIQQLIDRSDHIITISEFVNQEIRKYIRIDNKPVSVIYNGCQIFQKKEPLAPSLVPDRPFIFSLGAITPKKNFHVLPRLLINNDFQLVVSGNISNKAYQNQMMEEAVQLGVSNRLFFTGAVSEDEKQWYYTHCMAFAFPSLAEGFGLPVVEAMSFGKPVFLSRLTSLPEIGGKDAYYFDSFETESMASVFLNGMNDMEKHREEKVLAYQQWASRFSWDNCARQCMDVYISVMNNN